MSDLPIVNIGICGLGTVGQGVWKHITRSRAKFESRLGARLVLKSASVRDLGKKRSVRVAKSRLTDDPMALATDPKIQIVCELMGGTTLAKDVTLAALRLGKTVISANKALVCEHGPELFAAAREHGGHYFFEASVAGGIPIIKALREGLVANRFRRIYGILNGTCNYILTRMEREGLTYPVILQEAKALGYAEAEESLDVDGWDTAHKASILTHLAHGTWVPTKAMVVEGITQITQADIQHAKESGFAIKLLAVIEQDEKTDEIAVSVAPMLLPRTKVLANVNEVYNGIAVTGDVVGETIYIGRGAGQDATASAVISDIVDAIALLLRGNAALPEPVEHNYPLAKPENLTGRYYLRLDVKDEPGVLAKIATVTSKSKVSIASLDQRPSDQTGAASLILTTHRSNEKAIRSTVNNLRRLSSVLGEPFLLRIASFED
ncbi:homoserine dehydrogenase [Synoicihabitans lomoniglobus]|uniref:Homoserine dehydrogenase n=1 Tax=Synoicihabitans lomoniglobus TaxID=2909285 RepID=A0AAF0CR41_9BACT|nr:homoserine dehydrogenase [Opitutaceae bacterium LMO-M01]WED66513.1 homoserine dehydrogenase [Opitutaceae bacterium LMO-M01]